MDICYYTSIETNYRSDFASQDSAGLTSNEVEKQHCIFQKYLYLNLKYILITVTSVA